MHEGIRTAQIESKWPRTSIALLAAGSIALTGCTSPDKASATPTATSPAAGNGTLIFDDLGGGSSIIRVYQSARDKTVTGTYNSGDAAPADCKTTGRTVTSDPSVGEEPRTSSEWIHLAIESAQPQYATAVYTENPEKLLASLPEC